MRSFPVLILLLAATAPIAVAQPYPLASDVASPEALTRALYETVSRAPGKPFQWDRMRSLFVPQAILLPNPEQTGGRPETFTPETFIKWIDDSWARNAPIGSERDRGFAEEEIESVIERYGDIAHAFSVYQKHFWNDQRILGRGINTIQMVFREGRWWVVAMSWDEEAGAGPIPAKYLP